MQSLHDGIPDRWKEANGLSVSNATVANQVAPNGYTYLENYLNGTDPNLTASLGTTSTSGSLAAASLLTGFSDSAQSGGQPGRSTQKDRSFRPHQTEVFAQGLVSLLPRTLGIYPSQRFRIELLASK